MKQPTSSKTAGSRETATEIEQSAADWIARQDRGPLSEQEAAALHQWASGDPRRAGAYARAMAVNFHLDRVVALGESFAAEPGTVEGPTRRRAIAVAAGAVITSATCLSLYSITNHGAPSTSRLVETSKGAVRQIGLREGSEITLNTMTRIRPELTRSFRRIYLMQGEALFNVTSDPARPFIVFAGDISVRAVGTSFTVRRFGLDAIKLIVTEGVVEVSRKEEILGRVHAGIEFAVEAATTPVITNLDSFQLRSALAWREGRIDLHGYTLAKAAEEFSRYSDLHIEVNDPAVANLHITGMYATNDAEGFARDAALSLGVKSVRRGKIVTISRT